MNLVTLDAKFFPPALRDAAATHQEAACKSLEDLRSGRCTGGEFTGWFDWPRRHGFALAKEVTSLVNGMDVYFDTVVVIGIGGSYLGTRAVADALSHSYAPLLGNSGKSPRQPLLVYLGQNVSETALLETLDLLAERQPVVNVISKSGTTTEPAVAFRVVRGYLERRFGKAEAARRIIATTDQKQGALRTLATAAGYKTFVVPDDVGGRYSVLTAVGLVPLALAGFNTDSLLNGADEVFGELKDLNGATAARHPVLQYATHRRAAFDAGMRLEVLGYGEPRLASLVEWWKQLFGESEGKKHLGLFPAGLAYTTDLHSLGQYVQDGCRDLIETFLVVGGEAGGAGDVSGVQRRLMVPQVEGNADELGYLEGRYIGEINQAAMLGSKVAHFDGGVPCLSLAVPGISAKTVGGLIAFFETACAISALLLNVNPFDQPGVESYKKNLFGLLVKPGFESLGSELRRRL